MSSYLCCYIKPTGPKAGMTLLLHLFTSAEFQMEEKEEKREGLR